MATLQLLTRSGRRNFFSAAPFMSVATSGRASVGAPSYSLISPGIDCLNRGSHIEAADSHAFDSLASYLMDHHQSLVKS